MGIKFRGGSIRLLANSPCASTDEEVDLQGEIEVADEGHRFRAEASQGTPPALGDAPVGSPARRRHGTDVPGGALSEDSLLEQSSGRPDGRKLLDNRVHWMDEDPDRSDGGFAMEQCTRLVDGTPQPIFLDSYGRRTVMAGPLPARGRASHCDVAPPPATCSTSSRSVLTADSDGARSDDRRLTPADGPRRVAPTGSPN